MTERQTTADLRHALYYRLRGLRRPAVARTLRVLCWIGFAGWLSFVMLLLALRYVVLPGVSGYKGEIESMASQAIG